MFSIEKERTIAIGHVFHWDGQPDKWVFSLVVNSYHLFSSTSYKSEKLATEAMKKEYDKQMASLSTTLVRY